MKEISPDAKKIVVDRLGDVIDDLHQQARDRASGRRVRAIQSGITIREAADFLSEVRKEVQR